MIERDVTSRQVNGHGTSDRSRFRVAATPLPGLVLVAVLAVVSFQLANRLEAVSSLTVGVALGAIVANGWPLVRPFPTELQPGVAFAAKRLLRVGIVLLGFRLALVDVADLGVRGLVAVAIVVAGTFVGTRWLATRMGISRDLGLLVATGYSICGASAIAAMDGVIDAEEEEVAYAVALVTLCGSLSIALLPSLGHVMNMDPVMFGSWAGAAVHDVAQVIASAATYGDASTAAATVVKLTRVALLAPLVATVAVMRRRRHLDAPNAVSGKSSEAWRRPPLVPLFVVGFLVAVTIRSMGWLSERALTDIRTAEQWVLTFALVGLGLGVRLASLRRLGGRPLLLGLIAWVWVAVIALGGVYLAAWDRPAGRSSNNSAATHSSPSPPSMNAGWSTTPSNNAPRIANNAGLWPRCTERVPSLDARCRASSLRHVSNVSGSRRSPSGLVDSVLNRPEIAHRRRFRLRLR